MALSDTKSIVPRADQQGTIGTAAKAWGQIFIENPSDGGAAAASINNLDVDKVSLSVNGANTTANLLDFRCTTLTTGLGINFPTTHNPADTESALKISSASTFTGVGTSTFKDLHIDLNKTGITASGKTADIYGAHIDIDDSATNVGTVNSYGIAINNNFTSTGGTVHAYGLYTNISGGDKNYDIYMENSADSTEFAALQVGAGGALTVSTTSDDATGHLTLDVAGDIELNADGGDFNFKDDTATIATINASASFIPTVEYIRVLGYTNALSDANVYGPDISQGSTSHAWTDKLFNDGATEQASDPGKAIQAAQLVAGRAGYVRNLKGWIAGTNGQTITFRIFKATPTDDSAAALALTELGQDNGINTAMDGTGESTRIDYNATATTDLDSSNGAFGQGDLIIVGLQNSDTTNMTSRFVLTMEVVYTATS